MQEGVQGKGREGKSKEKRIRKEEGIRKETEITLR